MRYFLDTEYNGWGGALLSLALVPDDGEELYLTLDWDGLARAVGRAQRRPLSRHGAREPGLAAHEPRRCGAHGRAIIWPAIREPLIVADWPEDIALFNALLVTGPRHDGRSPGADVPISVRSTVSAPRRTARCRTMRCTTHARFATTSSGWSDYSAAVCSAAASRSIQVRSSSLSSRPSCDLTQILRTGLPSRRSASTTFMLP